MPEDLRIVHPLQEYIMYILKGISHIRFGITPTHLVNLLGEPDEKETVKEDTILHSQIFSFHSMGLSFIFEGRGAPSLISLECTNQNLLLDGQPLFALREHDIIMLMKKLGYEHFELEIEAWGEKRISFEDAMVDFYLENNKLIAVSWGIHMADIKD